MAELRDRLDRVEAQLHQLEREVAELRRLVAAEEEPAPPPAFLPPRVDAPAPEPEPERAWVEHVPVRRERREIDIAALLLDPRTLAWTGGVVTLLGIVFFFVLAAERGWIGPVARVSLGAIASSLLFAAGFELRRRYGNTYAALAAAGAGVAGGYMTLAASVLLYHQLSGAEALPVAALIAAAAAFAALRWNAQTLAALGLLGAMLAPAAIALQDHSTVLGGAFAALVLAAATAIAVRREWRVLQVASLVVTAPQVLALAYHHRAWTLALVVACALVYGGGAIALTLRSRLTQLSGWLLLASALFAGGSVALLYAGTAEGIGLLAVAGAYLVATVPLYTRDRDTATLAWAIAVATGGVAAADLTSGATLTIVWSAEAAVLALLARRLRDLRVEIGALVWLALAFAHALRVDAPVSRLFVENTHAGHSVASAAALALAAALIAWFTREWLVRLGGTILAGALALYAASLGLVALIPHWDSAHLAVAGLWAAVTCALALRFRTSALGLLTASVLLVILYDLPHLNAPQRWWACAPVAAAALVVALTHELESRERWPRAEALAALVASGGLAAVWAVGLFAGNAEGFALLGLAAAYAAVGVSVLRVRRDFASALGLVGLVFALPASIELLDGTWLVLAWAALAAALALAARFEQRLEYASLAYAACGVVYALCFEASPSHLFVAQRSPAVGVPALLLVVAALGAFVELRTLFREAVLWIGGVLLLYAGSLAILQLAEHAGGAVDTAFQRGHTGVSALWAVVGAALMLVGIRRATRRVQLGGLALFGASLAKLFLYDLAFLSSITRALSFLAVGAMLLAAGFAYQRVTATH